MIEQGQSSLVSSASSELEHLQRRANRHRNRQRQASSLGATWRSVGLFQTAPSKASLRFPKRFLLHALVVLVLPLAIVLSQLPPGVLTNSQASVATPVLEDSAGVALPVLPENLDPQVSSELGDAPLPDDADIPVPISLVSLQDALAPLMVSATISGDRVNVRNGPGTEYDVVTQFVAGQQLQIIGRYGDWLQVRESIDKPVFWASAELLDISDAAVSALFEVQPGDIPAPPPARVGTVREEGLQLRDGPGTNYIPLTKLDSNMQLDLLESYDGWFHVGVPGGLDGWVKGEFINLQPGVLERITVAEAIPDASPNMVGRINDNKVNLRKGPDSRYSKVQTVNSGLSVNVIGKYKDWIQIKLNDGSKAWVFSDLINISAHVQRRIPTTSNFPALPRTSNGTVARRSGNSANLANIAASGDVASFAVQFIGYPYRWGASSPSRGFDCSGLTSYVYGQHGVRLPRTAASQYSTSVGARIGSIDSLAAGDLVFFAGTGGHRGISHVAIYIGGGRIVHAMTPRLGVQVSNMYDRYWSSHFVGGIRPHR